MRRVATALRSLIVAIGLEGALITTAYIGLVFVGWDIDWHIGATVLLIGVGIAGVTLARPVRT